MNSPNKEFIECQSNFMDHCYTTVSSTYSAARTILGHSGLIIVYLIPAHSKDESSANLQ